MNILENIIQSNIQTRRFFGFSEEDFDNPYEAIRLEAYRTLGFTEKALQDHSIKIRNEARIKLDINNG